MSAPNSNNVTRASIQLMPIITQAMLIIKYLMAILVLVALMGAVIFLLVTDDACHERIVRESFNVFFEIANPWTFYDLLGQDVESYFPEPPFLEDLARDRDKRFDALVQTCSPPLPTE